MAKLRFNVGDARFEAEGEDAAVIGRMATQFHRRVLELELQACDQRLRAAQARRRELLKALRKLDESAQADDAVARSA